MPYLPKIKNRLRCEKTLNPSWPRRVYERGFLATETPKSSNETMWVMLSNVLQLTVFPMLAICNYTFRNVYFIKKVLWILVYLNFKYVPKLNQRRISMNS